MPASRFGLDWREMERESGMKRGKSGRIVFSGYLDTDGARKGGWAVGQSGGPRSTRKEMITGAAGVLVIHFAKGERMTRQTDWHSAAATAAAITRR